MTDKEFEEMMSEATITKDGLIQIEGKVEVVKSFFLAVAGSG